MGSDRSAHALHCPVRKGRPAISISNNGRRARGFPERRASRRRDTMATAPIARPRLELIARNKPRRPMQSAYAVCACACYTSSPPHVRQRCHCHSGPVCFHPKTRKHERARALWNQHHTYACRMPDPAGRRRSRPAPRQSPRGSPACRPGHRRRHS